MRPGQIYYQNDIGIMINGTKNGGPRKGLEYNFSYFYTFHSSLISHSYNHKEQNKLDLKRVLCKSIYIKYSIRLVNKD